MKRIFEILLPAKIDNTMRGSKIPCYVFAMYTIVSLIRSFIHLLAPDGGAGSIAGMDLSVAGARFFSARFRDDSCTRPVRQINSA
jgi:hypothetical protein